MIHLDAKTDYSFMRGFGNPKQWLERAEQINAPFLGVADYCSTWGHVPFRDTFSKSKIKLLYGVQLPVVLQLEKDPRHALVTIIAKHKDKGLPALYELVSTAHQQSYYRPRVTWKQVRELHGLCEVIVNDASISDLSAIKQVKGAYIAARPRSDQMLHFVRDSGLPVVAAMSPVYPSTLERPAFELMQAISDSSRVGEVAGSNFHMLREAEYIAAMRGVGMTVDPQWLKTAEKIAKSCKAELAPAVPIRLEGDLEQLARQGANQRGIQLDGPYGTRLARELSVIREKNFESYFLFVHDLVQWAKARMLVGPGRGSAGGSLLCYLLGITEVDPIRHGTLFERFIDITRPDWPDIDIDFSDTRRDLVFGYLRERYGAERVARLGTISEFGGKSALNDTAKATGIELSVARELGKFTEGAVQGLVIPLKRVFEEFAPELTQKHPQIRLAEGIEGHPRHHGVHAAGVVVNNEPITKHGAVDKNGTICMDMKSAENIGMIKMDALGLKTLSVIQDVCEQTGIDPEVLYKLDLEDEEVYRTIFSGDKVTGVFQFEGHTVRQLMKSVPVDCFEDLCALTSLARPGPLMGGAATEWCERRRGDAEWEYFHPLLEKHTKSTFGTIIYQEQAMGIVRDIGSFTEPEVNGFRRAVGKKDPEKLASYRQKFVAEAAAKFGGEEQANELWDKMCEFGSYAFNRSHAVAYSMISYITAWLKLKHPLQFALAQLRCSSDEDQAKQLLREISEEGHAYVPFDPNRSNETWAIIDGKLYGGFDSVKGVGAKTAQALLEKRKANPEGWLDELTESQRDRILRPNNTPWHSLTYFSERYGQLYADPLGWVRSYAPRGFKPPVLKIKDIPPIRGEYAFLGRIVRKTLRDMNDAAGLAKRNGKREEKNPFFINIYVADDTDEIGMTINRFKASSYQWIMDENLDDRDFFIRGDIINEGDGRRWLFVSNIVELKDDTGKS